jgi:hypothetical protein
MLAVYDKAQVQLQRNAEIAEKMYRPSSRRYLLRRLGFDQVTQLCVPVSPLYRPCWDFSGSFSVRRL